MKLHHLHPAEGAKKGKKRVGRGRAGVRGKTAGRGTKGTGARKNVPAGFEGGQMPLQRRVPKLKGFKNPNRVEYTAVNVEVLGRYFGAGEAVTPEALYEHGLARKGRPALVLRTESVRFGGVAPQPLQKSWTSALTSWPVIAAMKD